MTSTNMTIFLIMQSEEISWFLFYIGTIMVIWFGLKFTHVCTRGKWKVIHGGMCLLGALILILGLAIPNRETLIALYLANCVTPEDVENVKTMISHYLTK